VRSKQLTKYMKALEMLARPGGTTIKELADGLEIDRRSVYRLMGTMEELGVPLYDEPQPLEKEKRWKVVENYAKKLRTVSAPPVQLSLAEIVALYLLKCEAKIYKGTEIEQIVDSFFGKIGLLASGKLFEQLKKIKTLFISSTKFTKDYSGKKQTIDFLMDAMLQNKTCLVKYHSFGDDKIKTFKIDPLHFFESHGGLYIFVKTTSFGDIRILAVERIQELALTDSTFEYPEDFDPEERLDAAFDMVYDDPINARIWFSGDQARYVKERDWVKGQRVMDQPDGSVILEINTSGWWDVKKWVLSFGAEARVLEPVALRDEIIDELKRAHDKYQPPRGAQDSAE
jgi:predicted DNA-binding transcriptional regulator YafY